LTTRRLLGLIGDELAPGRSKPPDQDPTYDVACQAAITAIGAGGPGHHVPTLLTTSQRIYDAEATRRESINTRAGALIGTAGILGSLVVAAGQLGLDQKSGAFGIAAWSVLVLFVISLAYLAASLLLALRVQGARQGAVVDPTDLPATAAERTSDGLYNIRIAEVQLESFVYNYRLNNELKYLLLSSQRCLRNGLLAIILAGVISPAALRT
jgi:hypothetical protein